MNSVKENLDEVLRDLPDGVQLAAVSKFHTDETIMEAYRAGCRVFAENRPQEFSEKYERLPKDIQWHFIGHLQRNKVKDVVGKASLIHSVDSVRLLDSINREGLKKGVVSDILFEVFIASEETKHGFSPSELVEFISSGHMDNYSNVKVLGLMAMASYTQDETQIRREFSKARQLFDLIKGRYLNNLSVLSMGMSGDYKIAIECGSNLVRVGSKIFGPRQY